MEWGGGGARGHVNESDGGVLVGLMRVLCGGAFHGNECCISW